MRGKKRKGRKGLIIGTIVLIAILIVSLLGAVSMGAFIDVKQSAGKTYKKTKTIKEDKIEQLKSKNLDAQIGILILGIDNDREREATTTVEGKRSDTMMYVVYDGKDKTINMTTIPRDTFSDIYDGNGNYTSSEKINSAYSYGEIDGAINTFEQNFNLPVDYYATVNFLSFKKIVDAVGGITVNVPYNVGSNYWRDDAVTNFGNLLIKKGTQKLTGEQALIYARMRKYDDDIERGKRQQEVLKQVIKEALDIKTVDNYQKILKSVEDDVETNMSFDNMIDLASSMVNFNEWKMNSFAFDWTSGDINGSSTVFLCDDSKEYITHKMNVSLGLEEKDERDVEGYKFTSNGYSADKVKMTGVQ